MPPAQQTASELQRTKALLAEARSDLRKATAKIERLENERDQLKEGYEREVSILRRELQDAKILTHDRVKGLVGTPAVFHSKANKLSMSDVWERVTDLNEKIFQRAACLGKTLVHKSYRVSEEEMNYAVSSAQAYVGKRISDTLISESRKGERDVNPWLAQIALQVFITHYCRAIIQVWFYGGATVDKFLRSIYRQIHEKEDQLDAGRWRSMTRKYSRLAIEDWKDFLNKLNCVLRVAKWDISNGQTDQEFLNRFTPLFNAVQSVRNALGEDFTSGDLAVFTVEGRSPSDFVTDTYMEEAYRDPVAKVGPSGLVLGTTALGMKISYREKDEQGRPLYVCLLPAKVVLESTLQEALQPPLWKGDGRG